MSQINFNLKATIVSALPQAGRRDTGNATVPNSVSNGNPDRFDGDAVKRSERRGDSALTLETVAQAIEKYVPRDLPNTQLKIHHDDKTGLFVYKAVDRDSGEVMRQYPADEILRLITFYREREGLVVDDYA